MSRTTAWLNKDDAECGENLRFLTRTATNAYFPQVLTVISLPAAEDELTRLVEGQMDAIDWVTTEAEMALARRANPSLRAALEGWSDTEIVARVAQLRATGHQTLAKAPKVAEFDLLASGLAEIGTDAPDARLHARTLPREAWDGDRSRPAPIASVVAVHRLREVACLYGFTRFEAAPTAIDGDLEELHVAVEGAALAHDLDWLPSVEQLGEGIFLRFDPEAIAAWLARPSVAARHEALWSGWERWRQGQAYGDKLRFPPCWGSGDAISGGLPRPRGDPPANCSPSEATSPSPPPPRGSPPSCQRLAFVADVSPAPAGIPPSPVPTASCCSSLPRPRGDPPEAGSGKARG